MKYINEKCDICEKQFEQGDDVVVCPECGAPYHRSCYNEKGECVYAARHAEGFVRKTSVPDADATQHGSLEQQEREITCPRCGSRCGEDDRQCSVCGQKLVLFGVNIAKEQEQINRDNYRNELFNADADSEEQHDFDIEDAVSTLAARLAPGATEEQLSEPLCGSTLKYVIAFVGRKVDFYVARFRRIRDRSRALTFNFAAFLFSPIWFLYRKMYKAGAVVLVAHMVLDFLSSYHSLENADLLQTVYQALMDNQPTAEYMSELVHASLISSLLTFSRILLCVLCGILADRLYYSHTERMLSVMNRDASELQKGYVIISKGSVSPVAAAIGLNVILIGGYLLRSLLLY